MTFTVTHEEAPEGTVEARIVGATSTDTDGQVSLTCEVYVDGARLTNLTGWTFYWDVSTGGVLSGSGQSVTVSASEARTLIVTCTAAGSEGSDTDQHTVTVSQAATLTVSLSVASVVESHVTSINASATVGGTCTETIDYTWAISGGATVQEHPFNNNQAIIRDMEPGGSYDLQVVVRACGKTAFDEQTIEVEDEEVTPPTPEPPLTVSINVSTEPGGTTVTATIGGTATGAVTYAWRYRTYVGGVEIQDVTSSSQSLVLLNLISGRYEVDLTVQRGGHSASASTTITF